MIAKPIAFSGSMVRAIIAGCKTQTRRLVHPSLNGQALADHPDVCRRHAPYMPGDSLWVREDHRIELRDARSVRVTYAADGVHVPEVTIGEREYDMLMARKLPAHGPVVSSTRGRFMWRCLSRVHLGVLSVRAERLQAISEEDVIAEGIDVFADGAGYTVTKGGAWQRNPEDAYRVLWESLHGPYSWAANPWVWVVTFNRIDLPPSGS